MKTSFWMTTAAALALMLSIGCEQGVNAPAEATSQVEGHDEHEGHEDGDEKHVELAGGAGHDHSGWWCNEHGVPEDVCALCNSKVAADFQKKGDWCEEHDRPDSQCFIHHPELKEKFAAQYVAKYGKQPPEPTE